MAHDLKTTLEEVEAFGIAFIDSWVNTPRAELQQHFKTLEQIRYHLKSIVDKKL